MLYAYFSVMKDRFHFEMLEGRLLCAALGGDFIEEENCSVDASGAGAKVRRVISGTEVVQVAFCSLSMSVLLPAGLFMLMNAENGCVKGMGVVLALPGIFNFLNLFVGVEGRVKSQL
jgi:hypothetical protein